MESVTHDDIDILHIMNYFELCELLEIKTRDQLTPINNVINNLINTIILKRVIEVETEVS